MYTFDFRFKKSKRQNDWFRKAADEIGVDIEDEGLYPFIVINADPTKFLK